LRDELWLAPTPTAAAACVFVRDMLDYWRSALPEPTVVERSVLVASELVTNAVIHARTDLRRLELRGDWLHITVRDGSPRLLHLVTPNSEADPRPRVGVGCDWSSSSPAPGALTAIAMAARSSGAPSSCTIHAPGSGRSAAPMKGAGKAAFSVVR
jgi:hypothetical protein